MNTMKRWQLKSLSKEQLRGQWGNMALRTLVLMFIPVTLISILAFIMQASFVLGINELLTGQMFQNTYRLSYFIAIIVLLIGAVLLLYIMIWGYIEGFMKLRIGQSTTMQILFSKINMLPKILGYLSLMLLIALPGNIIEGLTQYYDHAPLKIVSTVVSLLILYLTLRFSMVSYILIENPYTTVPTAFKQSYFIMRGHCLRLFILQLSFIGWGLLCIFTLFIGFLWLAPYMQMTEINFYYDLKARYYEAKQEFETVI